CLHLAVRLRLQQPEPLDLAHTNKAISLIQVGRNTFKVTPQRTVATLASGDLHNGVSWCHRPRCIELSVGPRLRAFMLQKLLRPAFMHPGTGISHILLKRSYLCDVRMNGRHTAIGLI